MIIIKEIQEGLQPHKASIHSFRKTLIIFSVDPSVYNALF